MSRVATFFTTFKNEFKEEKQRMAEEDADLAYIKDAVGYNKAAEKVNVVKRSMSLPKKAALWAKSKMVSTWSSAIVEPVKSLDSKVADALQRRLEDRAKRTVVTKEMKQESLRWRLKNLRGIKLVEDELNAIDQAWGHSETIPPDRMENTFRYIAAGDERVNELLMLEQKEYDIIDPEEEPEFEFDWNSDEQNASAGDQNAWDPHQADPNAGDPEHADLNAAQHDANEAQHDDPTGIKGDASDPQHDESQASAAPEQGGQTADNTGDAGAEAAAHQEAADANADADADADADAKADNEANADEPHVPSYDHLPPEEWPYHAVRDTDYTAAGGGMIPYEPRLARWARRQLWMNTNARAFVATLERTFHRLRPRPIEKFLSKTEETKSDRLAALRDRIKAYRKWRDEAVETLKEANDPVFDRVFMAHDQIRKAKDFLRLKYLRDPPPYHYVPPWTGMREVDPQFNARDARDYIRYYFAPIITAATIRLEMDLLRSVCEGPALDLVNTYHLRTAGVPHEYTRGRLDHVSHCLVYDIEPSLPVLLVRWGGFQEVRRYERASSRSGTSSTNVDGDKDTADSTADNQHKTEDTGGTGLIPGASEAEETPDRSSEMEDPNDRLLEETFMFTNSWMILERDFTEECEFRFKIVDWEHVTDPVPSYYWEIPVSMR